jgi:hypothetical protein
MNMDSTKESMHVKQRQDMAEAAFGALLTEELLGQAHALAQGVGFALLNAFEIVIQLEMEFPGRTDELLHKTDKRVNTHSVITGMEPNKNLWTGSLISIIREERGRT